MAAKAIIIGNQKGGVGKTTTSVNLAYTLVEMGKKVLLIDFDPQSNTTKGLGIQRGNIKYSIADLMMMELEDEGFPSKEDFIIKFGNLDVIASTIALSGVGAKLNTEAIFKEKVLSDIIDEFRDEYDYIIMDTNPSLEILTINAFTAADSIIIPVDASAEALDGFTDLLGIISKIKKRINPKLKIDGVLITKYQKVTNNDKKIEKEIREACLGKIYVFETIIPFNATVKEAYDNRKPVVTYKKGSTGAKAYKVFASELVKLLEK